MRITRPVTILAIGSILGAFAAVPPTRAGQASVATGRSGQSEATLAAGTPIFAALNSSIDAKKAKVGDAVSAHTFDAVKSADGRIILPKGTKLTGRLAQAKARSKGDGESVLGIVFEKALLKDGGDVSLLVRVQAIAEPLAFSSTSSPSADTSSLGTTQTSPMGSNSRMGPRGAEPPQSGLNGAGESGNGSSADLNTQSRGVLGLRGLKLAGSFADGQLVSRVSSDGKNVHLDSGTRFLLVTAAGGPEEPADQQR
jgi:hypothetical protein